MLIYSFDQYFTLATNDILTEFKNRKSKKLILIDSGCKDLYIFKAKTLSGITHQDSFSALLNSQYISIPRNVSISNLRSYIASGVILFSNHDKKMDMTRMEESVLRAIYAGLSTQDIAAHYSISHKRVSTLRRGALTKMGIKNTSLFFSLLHSWDFFWPYISCHYSSLTKHTKHTKGMI